MEKIKTVVVGCGDRACVYAEEAVFGLQEMEIVACVDPDPVRLKYMQEHFGVDPAWCFSDQRELLSRGKIADCVINATMDQYHKQTAIPFLEQGYHMLLEKPIAKNAEDLMEIRDAARRNNCILMTCHVLRYAPFYRKIKELILNGTLGEVIHIETSERVSFFHASVSYIRGKWSRQAETGSSLMLAKCCHDIDLLTWLNGETEPVEVMSYGGRDYFVPEKAPAGAGTRCLVDCPDEIRAKCVYDVKPMYLDNCILPWYPWQCTGKNYWEVSEEEKIESLKTYNPHGVCAYKADGDLADHQSVNVRYANGSTALHTVILGCPKTERSIWVSGTEGEIEGYATEESLILRRYDRKTSLFTEEEISTKPQPGTEGGHFGGDRGLLQDFCRQLRGEQPSISCTSVDNSICGHMLVYASDASMQLGRPLPVFP